LIQIKNVKTNAKDLGILQADVNYKCETQRVEEIRHGSATHFWHDSIRNVVDEEIK